MFELSGKCALVTGATGGLGAAIATALHEQGAEVVLSGTRENVLNDLKDQLGGRAHAVASNLADAESVEGLVPAAIEVMGKLDILVNNAGITRDNISMRMKDVEWDDVLKINLTAAFRLARAAARPMMKARFGRIIGITSIVGITGNAGQANYAAAKAGMIGMTKSLAAELASRGITANCVAPGFIESPMTDALNDKQKSGILANVPAGKLGKPADVAGAVVYLASEEAGYVTGQTFHVNGGMAMI